MRRKIENRLLELGIMPNLKGFSYICDLVEMITDDTVIKYKMMYLYEVVAKKNKTTSTSVERAIRYAITRVDLGNWNGCYARSACTNLQNSEFLYTLALRIKQED